MKKKETPTPAPAPAPTPRFTDTRCCVVFSKRTILYSHVVFLPSFIVESSSLSTIKENIHPRTIHGVHTILDFLRHHLQESFPVLGSFAVQFGDHLRYWDHFAGQDHLRGRTVELFSRKAVCNDCTACAVLNQLRPV